MKLLCLLCMALLQQMHLVCHVVDVCLLGGWCGVCSARRSAVLCTVLCVVLCTVLCTGLCAVLCTVLCTVCCGIGGSSMCARWCGECAARCVECTCGGNCTAMMIIATFRGGSTGCTSTGGCGGDTGSTSYGITDICNSGGDCATGGLTVCVSYTTGWCRWE